MNWGASAWLWALSLPALLTWFAARTADETAASTGLVRASIAGSAVGPGAREEQPRPWRLLGALTLALLALARPQWGAALTPREEPAREIVIALDLSRSMHATDVAPSRLQRAHALVRGLLDGLEGERVALVVFSGVAFVQVPLSSDYQIMREFLPVLEPGYLPQGGSDYAAMLRAGAEAFSGDKAMDRTLFVLSDGESTTDDWRAALGPLVQRGVTIVAVGIGTASGGDLPGEEGNPAVRSRLRPEVLQTLAHESGGLYRAADATVTAKALLEASVERGQLARRARAGEHRPERFVWLLAPALVLAVLGVWRELPLRFRWRRIARRGAAPVMSSAAWATASSVAIVLTLGVRTASWAHDEGHDYGAEVTAAGKLQWLVEDLTQHTTIAPRDLAQLAERTINYGLETLARGNAIAEGTVRDALLAVERGEKMDPRAADWETLRSVLRRLLARQGSAVAERLPEQKKEALDEEDRPSQTNGQGSQQTTAESMGQGGASRTDASLGELRKETARRGPVSKVAAGQARPAGGGSGSAIGNAPDPLRAVTVRRYREVVRGDTPGVLFQALAGEATRAAEGGRDW